MIYFFNDHYIHPQPPPPLYAAKVLFQSNTNIIVNVASPSDHPPENVGSIEIAIEFPAENDQLDPPSNLKDVSSTDILTVAEFDADVEGDSTPSAALCNAIVVFPCTYSERAIINSTYPSHGVTNDIYSVVPLVDDCSLVPPYAIGKYLIEALSKTQPQFIICLCFPVNNPVKDKVEPAIAPVPVIVGEVNVLFVSVWVSVS